MAENEQRFVVHTASRKFARVAVYPAGLFLVVAAIFIPADEPMKFVAALIGLPFLMWSWSVDQRRRVEVTERNVTIVNIFSRHEVPWSELTDIEIDFEENDKGTDYYYLAFVTPSRRIRANMPYDKGDELAKVRARILRAREPSANQAQSDGQAAVGAQLEHPRRTVRQWLLLGGQLERPRRTVREWLELAFIAAFIVLLGLPVIFILVLDALAGDWLIDHVSYWDELIGFYDWLWSMAG